MNPSLRLPRFLPVSLLATLLLLPGCVSIEPAVKSAVDASRDEAAALHASHVQDIRNLDLTVNQTEAALVDASRAVRAAELAQLQTRIAAAKVEVLGIYDRRVAAITGIEFQQRLQDVLYGPFDQLEHKQKETLAAAERNEAQHPDDPAAHQRVLDCFRDLTATRVTLAATISRSYLALSAGLAAARFKFEAMVDHDFSPIDLSGFADNPAPDESVTSALAAYNTRVDQRLALLDQSYGALDQSLSDLSTYLDSEATSRRFAGHAFKGAAETLITELKSKDLGSAALAKLVNSAAPKALKQIKEIADQLMPAAVQAADTAAAAAASGGAVITSAPSAVAPSETGPK